MEGMRKRIQDDSYLFGLNNWINFNKFSAMYWNREEEEEKKSWQKKSPGLMASWVNSTKCLNNTNSKNWRKGTLPMPFYEANTALIPKPVKTL